MTFSPKRWVFLATDWQYCNYVFLLPYKGFYCPSSVLWPVEVFFKPFLISHLAKIFWCWLFLGNFTSWKIERKDCQRSIEWKLLKRFALTCETKWRNWKSRVISKAMLFFSLFLMVHKTKIFTDLSVLALMRYHRRIETGDSDSITKSSRNFKDVFVRTILSKNN